MKLYDGRSSIDWFYQGTMTADQMRNDEGMSALFEQPCILMDDGVDKVYSFRTLESMADQYGVEKTGDAEKVFSDIMSAASSHEESEPPVEDRISDLETAICELYESMA